MKDWSIILVCNERGNWFQRIYWKLIRVATASPYNHCQLVREFNNGEKMICESDVSGFRITKTVDKWIEEQIVMKRKFIVLDPPVPQGSNNRFKELLGNKYDVGYWTYLTKSYSSNSSTNCFQSIAYIFGVEKHWLATANTFLRLYYDNNITNLNNP